jgi:hypothetical protein
MKIDSWEQHGINITCFTCSKACKQHNKTKLLHCPSFSKFDNFYFLNQSLPIFGKTRSRDRQIRTLIKHLEELKEL